MKKLDLTGQKYGRLTVISEIIGKKCSTWKCQCECGNITNVSLSHLRDGHTRSCGCFNLEKMSERAPNLYASCKKYHPSETSARRVWQGRYCEENDTISFEDFYQLSQQNCFYCGVEPNNKQNSAIRDKNASQCAKDNGDFIYNGLDRIDNLIREHTVENCVPCCKFCNFAKRDRSIEDFKQWIIRVYNHLILTNWQ